MTLHYIKQWLLVLLVGAWTILPATAQDINSLSPSALPVGSYVTGLYHLEANDGSSLYLQEQADGSLAEATLSTTDSGFYFWVVENVYYDYFQLYSATQDMKLMQLNSDGSIQWTTNDTEETTKLLFRMHTTGPERTAAHATAGIVATGYITTDTLSSGYGNADCQCNFLTVESNARFRLHNSGVEAANYRPVVFENTDPTGNTNGTVTEDLVNNVTRITQATPAMGFEVPHNFVSSNFYVGGFGEDDFQITVSSGAEGYIGFLEYTDHHYTKEVYKEVQSPIGIKIAGDVISLVYRQGFQEVITDIDVDEAFSLGFKDQDSLIVSQTGKRHGMARTAPAELYFNQSVTQSARMIVALVEGSVDIAYTTKNSLISSENDKGTDDGSNLVSTNAFFPYNGGDDLLNTFDWETVNWNIRYESGVGTVETTDISPFYDSNTSFSGITAKYDLEGNYQGGEDFASVEGWELIKANLGYNADGTVKSYYAAVGAEPTVLTPNHPYVMFYDRIGSILRVFVYTNNESVSNQLMVSLSPIGGTPINQSGYTPKLWGSLQQFASLDQVQSSQYSKALPFYGSSGRSWYFADFVMEYDPCIAFFESTIELKVEKLVEGDLAMIGRLEGGSIPAGTTEYDNWQNQRENFLMGAMDNDFGSLENTLGDITLNQYADFDLLDFQTEVEGTLTGAAIEDWEKEKARIEWEATETIGESTIAEGVATIVAGTAQVAGAAFSGIPLLSGVSEAVQGFATIAQGGAQIASGEAELRLAYANKLYYNAIKDKVREEDQAISMDVPPPRPQAVFGELALSGTISIITTLIDNEEFIATPGGLNSDSAPEWYASGSRGSEPLYNKPMGHFALLKQPEFGIGIAHNGNNGGAWLKIKEKPYFAHNNTPTGKIDDVLNLSVQVQTLDTNGAVQSNITGGFYTNLFGVQNSNSLPGELDISDLIDWAQLETNINTLGLSENQVGAYLSGWIRVSYEVWSMTLTTLKSRDLQRIMADGNHYYTGNSSFAYSSSYAHSNQLSDAAETLAASSFSGYGFSDDSTYGFGSTYTLYHTDYDKASDAFYAAMSNYCTNLSPASKDAGGSEDVKGQEEEVAVAEDEAVAEEPTVEAPGLTVYPNPAQHQVSFRMVSEQAGRAVITLYDLTGKALIGITDYIDGVHNLQGHITIAPLPAGVYILEVKLPDGKSITKKIVKQ